MLASAARGLAIDKRFLLTADPEFNPCPSLSICGFFNPNLAVVPEPTDEANRCNLRHVAPKTLQKALYVGLRDMKLQCLPLKYGQFITKPCVSPQVFYRSRRQTRCVLGSGAFGTMEQTWESQSGGALKSDDTVKTK
jgi:hypothetical protein